VAGSCLRRDATAAQKIIMAKRRRRKISVVLIYIFKANYKNAYEES
jgi:hypothetical protein